MSGSYAALEGIAARDSETREAQARPARVRFFVKTRGTGDIRMTGGKALYFGAFMLEEPSFSYGVIVEGNLGLGAAPLATAMVLKWKRQGKFWMGAEMAFAVDTPDMNTRLKFSLTFEGSTLRTTKPMRSRQ